MGVPQAVSSHCLILVYQTRRFVKGCSWLTLNLQALVGNNTWRSGRSAHAFGCYQVQGRAGSGPHLQNLSATEPVVVKAVFGNHWDPSGSISLFIVLSERLDTEKAFCPEGTKAGWKDAYCSKTTVNKTSVLSQILWQQKSDRRGWTRRKFLICHDRKQSCVLSKNSAPFFLPACHMSAILTFLYKCSFTEMSSENEL